MLMKKLITLLILFVGMVSSASAQKWVVAGSAELCGSSWAPTDDANKMTSDDGTNYSITYYNIVAGNYEFKVTNGTWDEAYPVGGSESNYKLTVSSLSKVTITFNSSTKTVNATQEPLSRKALFLIYHPTGGSSWKVGEPILYNTESENYKVSLSLNIAEKDYFAFSDESLHEGLDYTTWTSVVRPVSDGNYHMSLQYSSGSTTTDDNGHVWQVIDNATYSFAYNPDFSIFKCNAEATGSISAAGWATYSTGGYEGSNGYTISGDDVQAYYVSASADGKATLAAISSESVIPNKAGIMLKGSGTFTVRSVKGDAIDLSTNMLKGSGSYTFDITGVYNFEFTKDSYTGYVLGGSGETLGFYRVDNTNASARTLNAHKAFLYVSNETGAHSFDFISLDNETTGIETVKATQKMNGEFFNLAGQRVAQPTKGLYIVNGKKVIMK